MRKLRAGPVPMQRCASSEVHQPALPAVNRGREEVLTVQGKSCVDERVDAATGSCGILSERRRQLFGAHAAKVGLVKSAGKLQHRHEAVPPGPRPVLALHTTSAVFFTSMGWALVTGRGAWKALSET